MLSGHTEDDENETEFRHKLVSSAVAPKATYAIGLLKGEQVHLTPLQAVLQVNFLARAHHLMAHAHVVDPLCE